MRNSILFVKDNLESYQKVAICLTKQTLQPWLCALWCKYISSVLGSHYYMHFHLCKLGNKH